MLIAVGFIDGYFYYEAGLINPSVAASIQQVR
jgi:hypothetical protein